MNVALLYVESRLFTTVYQRHAVRSPLFESGVVVVAERLQDAAPLVGRYALLVTPIL
jgi:hypothetical protein